MKAEYIIPVIAILLVVTVSGCVDFPGFSSLFGTNQQTVEQSPDIIIMKDVNVIPNPPIMAGNDFSLTFILKNQDMSGQEIKNVDLKLYNWGVCEPKYTDDQINFYPDGWEEKEGYWINTFDEMTSQEEQLIELEFTAPSNERIGKLSADCPIKWEVSYDFSAISQDDFAVISRERNKELAKAGLTWEGSDQPEYVGIGPVKLYYRFNTPMPVQSGSSIQFALWAEDRGVGIYPKILANTMFIKVPKEWVSSDFDTANASCKGGFEVLTSEQLTTGTLPNSATAYAIADVGVDKDDYVTYTNYKDISFINRKTPEIICSFTAPDLDTAGVPEKTYLFSANVTDYNYKVLEDQTVNIKPSV
ncbi:MAG: hypothetical protein PHU12_00200 [Candidatus Aenigmarchaeota archaeon]|nr:hypothetical protein [Candidatus Aenigmarchaeota archaeon]